VHVGEGFYINIETLMSIVRAMRDGIRGMAGVFGKRGKLPNAQECKNADIYAAWILYSKAFDAARDGVFPSGVVLSLASWNKGASYYGSPYVTERIRLLVGELFICVRREHRVKNAVQF
jgi:hypothetical protein